MNVAGMEMTTTWTKTDNWFVGVQNVRLANFGRMNKYFSLALGVANAVCIPADTINQNWDILVLNIIACVLCLGNFMASD